jgi:hypothetical protein
MKIKAFIFEISLIFLAIHNIRAMAEKLPDENVYLNYASKTALNLDYKSISSVSVVIWPESRYEEISTKEPPSFPNEFDLSDHGCAYEDSNPEAIASLLILLKQSEIKYVKTGFFVDSDGFISKEQQINNTPMSMPATAVFIKLQKNEIRMFFHDYSLPFVTGKVYQSLDYFNKYKQTFLKEDGAKDYQKYVENIITALPVNDNLVKWITGNNISLANINNVNSSICNAFITNYQSFDVNWTEGD